MQSTKAKSKKQVSRTMQLLCAGLEELTHQMVDGDFEAIAKKAKISERTVLRYIKHKEVKKYVTGKAILDKGRAIILERQHELKSDIKKLVA